MSAASEPHSPPFFSAWCEDLQKLGASLPDYAAALEDCQNHLDELFLENYPIVPLLHTWSQAADAVLSKLWSLYGLDKHQGLALIAVGGYGRAELHPGSDIDLLVLMEEEESTELGEALSRFLTALWDVKLDIGHSVRTLDECIRESDADLSTMTNMLEARLLAGSELLMDRARNAVFSSRVWDDKGFYLGKIEERENREKRYGDTAYSLEPNIKESPGGLRDFQTVKWIANRHFGTIELRDIISDAFLTEEEYSRFIDSRDFLWRVRWSLHRAAGRKEDRLLFDYQHNLAEQFGYHHELRNLATEAFMRRYYRVVMNMKRLTDTILQLFDTAIVTGYQKDVYSRKIGGDYCLRSGYLEIVDPEIFGRCPETLLEVFLVRMQNPEVKAIGVRTKRLIRSHTYLIDDHFRSNPRCRQLFMDIVRQGDGVTHAMRSMNEFGVLGAYMPAFDAITGLMQFDMFHVYTVDEHTMQVLKNTRRLALEIWASEHPEGHKVFKLLPKPELLYLAALFHDIAKGRGGNHATNGAKDALEFAHNHGLSIFDGELLAWIVEHHLDMSMTAQRMDISDPEVIKDFAAKMQSPLRLRYLYLLTICDIRGTNPQLWNDWKSQLLSSLYHRTLQWLTQVTSGSDHLTHAQYIRDTKFDALRAIAAEDIDEQDALKLWEDFSSEYFRRYEPDEIVWHTRTLLENRFGHSQRVFINPETPRGATEILVYAPSHPGFFRLATRGIEQLGLNVVNAKVYTTHSQMALDTFSVLEDDGSACREDFRLQEVQNRLNELVSNPDQELREMPRRLSRQLKSFNIPPQITFNNSDEWHDTLIDLSAPDYPGLLADVAQVLYDDEISLKIARIATVSERAQDILHVHTDEQQPLSLRKQHKLRDDLLALINRRLQQA